MGRKWTNVKFDIEQPNKHIPEASSNPRTREEAVYDFAREEWSEDNVAPAQSVDVMFGNLGQDKLERYMDKFFNEFDYIERAAVIFVTDSAHIGYGWVFERSGDPAQVIEEYSGYEGANGNDVAGMISDEYHINVSAEWFWG